MKKMDWFQVGRDWFPLLSRGKDWFRLVSRGEGLILAGFRVGRTGFSWFHMGRTGFGWFWLVPLFSNYLQNFTNTNRKLPKMQFFKMAFFCCHYPSTPPPIFRRHSLKLLSPTLPILMNWILLSPPPLSSDPDTPPKFGTCTRSDTTLGNMLHEI